VSYDFLGTFNKSQFDRFIAFARSQVPYVEARINHIRREQVRIGSLSFTFDANNLPSEVVANPTTSYLAKLLAAYEVLGGNPFLDLRSRTMDQAVFVRKGSETLPASMMSSGEVLPTKGLRDAFSAELVRSLRGPLQETLHRRFEALERKIRRSLDYSDQLTKELVTLQLYQEVGTLEGSLEFVADQVQNLLGDPTYRAIYNDNGTDPLGLNTYAPFSQYDVEPSVDPQVGGPRRTADLPRRQDTGFIGPGGTKGSGSI